jgi:hypothetical protein
MLAHPRSDYFYIIGFRPEQTLAVEVPLVFNRFFVLAIYQAAARVLWKLKRRILSVSQKETGSWGESDRGGTRLCKKVHKVLAEWKIFLDVIG